MADHAAEDESPNSENGLVSEDNKPVKYNGDNDIEIQLSDNNDHNASDNNRTQQDNNEQKDEFYTAKAHRLRRIYHVCIFTITPILYFWTAQAIADGIGVTVPKILSFLILVAVILELIRLKCKFIIFGMREYERDHISAQAWGTISELIVLLLAFPRTYSISPVIVTDANGETTGSEAFACFGQVAIPLIWSLGIGDPLLGELKKLVREKKIKLYVMYIIAWITLLIIWIMCMLWCGTHWLLVIIIPPIAIIAEKPSIAHIDDNGLMLLVPLLFTLIFEPWFQRECNQIFYK